MKKKLLISLFIVVSLFLITGCGKTQEEKENEKVKIVASETKNIEYEEYNNGLIKIMIPKGWKVELPPVDYIHYSFKVYNPDKPDLMYIYCLKLEGFLKSKKARDTYKRLYPTAVFSKLPYIDPQTTEAYYKVFTDAAILTNKEDLKMEYLPHLNEFTVIENMGKSYLDGDILRASFKKDDGSLMEGLFTASVFSAGSYYISGVDVFPLNVYNTIMLTAPDSEFAEWQDVMDHSIGTLEFTETFVSKFNASEAQLVNTVIANQKVLDSIGDMIMDSWEKRSRSYDIISQKRSDATLGYERVYDTDTGDVYKAYNGFTDNYHGQKYQPITDDMYGTKISGYIEK